MRVTSKGQVTIPKHIRDKLGIGPGDEVGFREEGQAVILESETPPAGDGDSRGKKLAQALIALGRKARQEGWDGGLTTEEIMEMTRGPFNDVEPR